MIYKLHMKSACKAYMWMGIAVLVVMISSCVRPSKGTQGSSTTKPSAAPQVTAPGTVSAATVAMPKSKLPASFDSCLKGTWRSSGVKVNHGVLKATGGENVELTIISGGNFDIDFSAMSLVKGHAGESSFEFRYKGKGTGKINTAAAGAARMSRPDLRNVHVDATMKATKGSAVPLLTNQPVANLIPRGEGQAANPSTQGIDPNPVLSANSYTCSQSQLILTSDKAFTQWTFNRVGKTTE